VKFELDINEVNVIMAALGRMPYETVFALVDKIRAQAAPQLEQVKELEKEDK